MRGKALSTKKIQRAKELKRQGVPYRDIANKLGISLGAIAANTKDIAVPTRATHKYSEGVAQEAVQQPRIITPPHRRPFKFEGVGPKRQKTAEELRVHYKQIDYYKDQVLKQTKEFYRLLDEGTSAEAEDALQKKQEAWRKLNELLS